MEVKPFVIGLALGVIITLASVWTYLLLHPPTREIPVPPRIEFITTDLDTCTVDYVKSRFCEEIKTYKYEEYPDIIAGEYWCTCYQ